MKKLPLNICISTVMLGAVLALSACNKPATPADGSTGAATPPADAPAPATSTDPLASIESGSGLKAGLWESTMNMPGMTSGMTTKMCLDEGLSKKFSQMGSSNPGKMDCAPVSGSRAGNVIDIDTQCKMEGRTANTKMHMELSGDGNSYHQTVETSFDPPMGAGSKVTVDGKYLGACPATMRAGDMEMMGGVKINMYDVAAKAKAKG